VGDISIMTVKSDKTSGDEMGTYMPEVFGANVNSNPKAKKYKVKKKGL